MAILKDTIKSWFQTGLKPTQEQFWAWMDSFWHKDEKIPITAIDDIEGILDAKAEAEALTNHINDLVAHSGPQDLQGVLENGRTATLAHSSETAEATITVFDEVAETLEFEIDMNDSLANSRAKIGLNTLGKVEIHGLSGEQFSDIKITEGILEISQSQKVDEDIFTTTVDFEAPIANTQIIFPAKPEGEYVLALIDDIYNLFYSLQEINLVDPDNSENYIGLQKNLVSIKKSLLLPAGAVSSEPSYGHIGCQSGNVSLSSSQLQPNGYLNKRSEIFCIGNSVQLVCEDYNHTNSTSYSQVFAVSSYQFEFSGNTPNGYKRIFLKLDNTVLDTTFNMPSSGFNLTTEEWVSQNFVKKAVVPASATATGVAGQIAFDADYIYLCVETDTWKRTPLTTW